MIQIVECKNGHEVTRVVVIEDTNGRNRVGLLKGEPEPTQKDGLFVWTCSTCGDEVRKFPR